MQATTTRKVTALDLRARFPLFARIAAAVILICGLVLLFATYRPVEKEKPFVMFSGDPKLSKSVQSIVEGYERTVNDNGKIKLVLRAARDITYTDGHHELEAVHLENYPDDSTTPDVIDAARAMYDSDKGEVQFSGNVNLQTRDKLRVQTESAVYNQYTQVAKTFAPVVFERENVRGRANQAVLQAKQKKLELNGDVAITVEPNALNSLQRDSSNGGFANDNSASTNASDRRSQPVTIRADKADFEQATLALAFSGNASAEQQTEIMRGNVMRTRLNEAKRVRHIEVRGAAYLRSQAQGRAAEVSAEDMDFYFTPAQVFERAEGVKNVNAKSLDSDAEMNITNAAKIEIGFDTATEKSLLRTMRADGRPTISLSAPRSQTANPNAANKVLIGDTVSLFWRAASGKDLERAEVNGNAELTIEPLNNSARAERKKIIAPRFDLDFYEAGNIARSAKAASDVKITFEPLNENPVRTLEAREMTATFARASQDVETMDATGDARFNEADRNGIAASVTYSANGRTVKLRGGEPVLWDSRVRLKANEIDSNLDTKISVARGGVQTTYYTQEQTGGAAPFAKTKSPVFVASSYAEFHHEAGLGTYTGNARLWQDDNFVKGERIVLRRDAKRMDAEGNVESALYQVKQKTGDARGVVPVFAIANKMFYSEPHRQLHYEGAVDIRQGTDRITSEAANVFLQERTYEVERTVAERNVTLTQPGRKGSGDAAQFTAADETVTLTGNPARLEDTEQGLTESRRLTVFLREKRVTGDDPTGGTRSTGRVRSVHKVRNEP